MKKFIDSELNIELYKIYGNWNDVAKEYEKKTGDKFNVDTHSKNYRRYIKKHGIELNVHEELHKSERYIEVGTTQMVTEDELLSMHGFDPLKFQLVSCNSTRSKIGTKANDNQYFINTYSKITVKAREFELTEDILLNILKESFNNSIKKDIKVNINNNSNGYMLIPLKDMHIKTCDQYIKHQQEIYNYIHSKNWKEIAIIIGSDLFNTNDSHGRTYNDTQVDTMETTLSDRMIEARKFYEPLIDASLENADSVKVIYEPGNHDRDTALTFVTALSWMYENVEHINFDLKDEDYKLIKFNEGKIVIPTHHGDKKSTVNAAAETFQRYFGKEIALADYAEGVIGHKHHRWSGEHMNLFIQGLSTANDDTEYEKRMGFAKGYKAFTIRIYDDYGLKNVPVINGSSIIDY